MSPALVDVLAGPAKCEEEKEIIDPVAAELNLQKDFPPDILRRGEKQLRWESGSMQKEDTRKNLPIHMVTGW